MQQSPILSDFHASERPRERKSSRRRNAKKKEDKKPPAPPPLRPRAKSSTQLVKDTANQFRLYAWHELESWQQDNEFLHSGYRKATNSYRQSLASLSYIHNQTANIYSHVIGAFLFICFGFFVYLELVPRYQTADLADLCIFALFGVGAMGCFGLSAFFHTVGNHSEGVYHSWLLLDLYGILGLICGTVYSGVFYGFYCERNIWIGYAIEVGHVFFFFVWGKKNVLWGDECLRFHRSHLLLSSVASSVQSLAFAPRNTESSAPLSLESSSSQVPSR
jgi:hypothetical protein